MLYWVAIFGVIASIAGVFAFGNISSASALEARAIFMVFFIAAGTALVGHFQMRRDGEKIEVGGDALTPLANMAVLKRIATGISMRLRR